MGSGLGFFGRRLPLRSSLLFPFAQRTSGPRFSSALRCRRRRPGRGAM